MTRVDTRFIRAAYVCVSSSLSPYAQTVTKHGVGCFKTRDKTDWPAEFARYGNFDTELLAAETWVQQKLVGGCFALRCMSNELCKICLWLFDLAASVCSTDVLYSEMYKTMWGPVACYLLLRFLSGFLTLCGTCAKADAFAALCTSDLPI